LTPAPMKNSANAIFRTVFTNFIGAARGDQTNGQKAPSHGKAIVAESRRGFT
jgi:hypothetical protein